MPDTAAGIDKKVSESDYWNACWKPLQESIVTFGLMGLLIRLPAPNLGLYIALSAGPMCLKGMIEHGLEIHNISSIAFPIAAGSCAGIAYIGRELAEQYSLLSWSTILERALIGALNGVAYYMFENSTYEFWSPLPVETVEGIYNANLSPGRRGLDDLVALVVGRGRIGALVFGFLFGAEMVIADVLVNGMQSELDEEPYLAENVKAIVSIEGAVWGVCGRYDNLSVSGSASTSIEY